MISIWVFKRCDELVPCDMLPVPRPVQSWTKPQLTYIEEILTTHKYPWLANVFKAGQGLRESPSIGGWKAWGHASGVLWILS